jgi:hypothetical protein
MGIRHLKDGQDFGPEHFDKGFGFSGSSEGYDEHSAAPPFAGTKPTSGPHMSQESTPAYADGGHVHPHGHHVVRVEHRGDGAVVHHHKHGGFSILHPDGSFTHHLADGHAAMAHGGMHHGASVHSHPMGHEVSHVESHGDREVHHHKHGGYTVHHEDGRITHHNHDGAPMGHGAMVDMAGKAVFQHETQEHDGEHSDLHLARGGMAMPGMGKSKMRRPKMPKGEGALTEGSAINRPPRNPMMSTTPRNAMPAGQMPYGVEPSAEPDVAGSGQNIPQLHRGGRMRS